MRVAVVDDVEPMTSPAFTVARRGEEFFDEFFVSQRIAVLQEYLDFSRRRREAKQVEVHAANQRLPLGFA